MGYLTVLCRSGVAAGPQGDTVANQRVVGRAGKEEQVSAPVRHRLFLGEPRGPDGNVRSVSAGLAAAEWRGSSRRGDAPLHGQCDP